MRIDTGKTVVKIDPKYFRPAEVDKLLGDATKAKQQLDWSSTIQFAELVKDMVDSDITLLRKKLYGHKGTE